MGTIIVDTNFQHVLVVSIISHSSRGTFDTKLCYTSPKVCVFHEALVTTIDFWYHLFSIISY